MTPDVPFGTCSLTQAWPQVRPGVVRGTRRAGAQRERIPASAGSRRQASAHASERGLGAEYAPKLRRRSASGDPATASESIGDPGNGNGAGGGDGDRSGGDDVSGRGSSVSSSFVRHDVSTLDA